MTRSGARAIMIQGTGSNVGKSLIVAGLARACLRRGLSVAPFKPQNMSNNAAVTPDGGEIGRAQALQARAAGRAASVHMNPVLLKPETETGAQVILRGRRVGRAEARDWFGDKPRLLGAVLESFAHLRSDSEIVLVEGAGSPAETNLRAGDIANMGFARAADVPVILLGDIDRGGVIAQIVGTQAVLDAGDRAQVAGFAINRFRGDVRLFDEGLADIVARTGWPSLGVIPWFTEAWRLPAEDALDLVTRPGGGPVRIAVPLLPRIANFDDLDPLAAEPGVSVDLVAPGRALPGDAAVILLPGSKATIADLAFLRSQGWDIDLTAHLRRGGHVVGLCGGYQMLGRSIADPEGIEGPAQTVPGLGLLEIDTVISGHKTLAHRHATCVLTGTDVTGYEIHMGHSHGSGTRKPWFRIGDRTDGAVSRDGRVRGSYLHGAFGSDGFRSAWLAGLGAASDLRHDDSVEATLDALAAHLERHLDIDRLLSLARRPRG